MRISFETESLSRLDFPVGTKETVRRLPKVQALRPFSENVVSMLDDVSKKLMIDREARSFSDVIAFAFWIRRASVLKLRERFRPEDDHIRLGRGVAFHIAPSNVPVNFAYSLSAGLLTGNANVVRVPSQDFPQVRIITDALNRTLELHPDLKPYVICVRYGREKAVNDLFSALCDVRIIWGGDRTVAELRRSPLPPRAGDITFADRYSMAVINAEAYLAVPDKEQIAVDFYNDTFLTDQNACTSPRIVVWMGEHTSEARTIFWEKACLLVKQRYGFQPVQAVNKLARGYQAAVGIPGLKLIPMPDNLIFRIQVPALTEDLMDYRESGGYFYEYCCRDILELQSLCDDRRCQTVTYIGDCDMLRPLIETGIHGVDRVVPMGKAMDFDLIWDGYDLSHMLTRVIVMR